MSDSRWNGLPFNLDDVVHRRRIEDNRVEYKATWNQVIEAAVVRTVAAFANDLLNLNGGYILLGIEDAEGRPILPPRGLDDLDLDLVQKEIYGVCQQINPPYQARVFPVEYQGHTLILIWAPAGDTRPYQAPEEATASKSPAQWFVRQGPMTVVARGEVLRQLMETTGRTPFDDRRSLQGRLEDISPALVRRFLHEIKSDLIDADPPVADCDLYDRLRLAVPVNGHWKRLRSIASCFKVTNQTVQHPLTIVDLDRLAVGIFAFLSCSRESPTMIGPMKIARFVSRLTALALLTSGMVGCHSSIESARFTPADPDATRATEAGANSADRGVGVARPQNIRTH